MNRREKLLKLILSMSLVFAFSYRKYIDSIKRQHLARRPMNKRREDDKRRPSQEARENPLELDVNLESPLLARLARLYRNVFLGYASLMLVKNIALGLLDLDYFRDYRYLDCYLVGRVVVDGRFCRAAKYLAILFSGFQLIWIYLLDISHFAFCFDSVEFLAYDYSTVLATEARAATLAQIQAEQRTSETAGGVQSLDKFIEQQHPHASAGLYQHPTLFYGNRLIKSKAGRRTTPPAAQRFKLRPNRTSAAWRGLARFTLTYQLICAVALVLSTPLFGLLLTPLVFTNLGFELSYSHCMDHLSGRSEPWAAYVPTMSHAELVALRADPPIVLPISGFKSATAYNALTSTADIVDNVFFWTATTFSFIFDTYVLLMIAIDVSLYLDTVERRVELLTEQLEEQYRRATSSPLARRAWGALESVAEESATRVTEATTATQSMLMDFFSLIHRYEVFVCYYLLFCIALWLSFTVTICIGILSPTSTMSLVQLEIYALEVFASVYFCSIVGYFNQLRNRIRRLYAQIATIMALEGAHEQCNDTQAVKSKERWMVLLQYFYPQPLYCFSAFGKVEINWFFSMKLVAWIFSAILVASSFDRIFEQRNKEA